MLAVTLFEKVINVHALNMGLVEDTPTGRLILSVMLAFAEFERDMIERTQEGKAIAKQRADFREGRPNKFKIVGNALVQASGIWNIEKHTDPSEKVTVETI